MKVSYFKRYKMELDLVEIPSVPALPAGYVWTPWSDAVLAAHAECKFHCFHDELDANVFANLATREGCLRLMNAIRRKAGFLAEATWLITAPDGSHCATVQGIHDRTLRVGAIQNLGVVAAHRGRGLGRALLMQAMRGFALHGLGRAYLEVTAQNEAAVQLYRAAGFRCRKTLYKAIEAGTGEPLPVGW